jgi:hypothetical protein
MLWFFNNSSFNFITTLSVSMLTFLSSCSMRRRSLNGWRGCKSRMTFIIVRDLKVMPDLITKMYEQIYVYVFSYLLLIVFFFFTLFFRFLFVIYFNWMTTDMYIWHGPHLRCVVREDPHKEGRHLLEWTYTGPMRMLLIYFTNIFKLCVWYDIIQYKSISCWRRTGEDDAEFIQWFCRHAKRLSRHGALSTKRRVRTGGWEAWVRGESSAGWAERYSCLGYMFLIHASLIGGTIWGHVSGLGRIRPEDGRNASGATGWAREEWCVGAAHVRIRGLHVLNGSITTMSWCSVFICKRR